MNLVRLTHHQVDMIVMFFKTYPDAHHHEIQLHGYDPLYDVELYFTDELFVEPSNYQVWQSYQYQRKGYLNDDEIFHWMKIKLVLVQCAS
jgi:hypothetical protein